MVRISFKLLLILFFVVLCIVLVFVVANLYKEVEATRNQLAISLNVNPSSSVAFFDEPVMINVDYSFNAPVFCGGSCELTADFFNETYFFVDSLLLSSNLNRPHRTVAFVNVFCEAYASDTCNIKDSRISAHKAIPVNYIDTPRYSFLRTKLADELAVARSNLSYTLGLLKALSNLSDSEGIKLASLASLEYQELSLFVNKLLSELKEDDLESVNNLLSNMPSSKAISEYYLLASVREQLYFDLLWFNNSDELSSFMLVADDIDRLLVKKLLSDLYASSNLIFSGEVELFRKKYLFAKNIIDQLIDQEKEFLLSKISTYNSSFCTDCNYNLSYVVSVYSSLCDSVVLSDCEFFSDELPVFNVSLPERLVFDYEFIPEFSFTKPPCCVDGVCSSCPDEVRPVLFVHGHSVFKSSSPYSSLYTFVPLALRLNSSDYMGHVFPVTDYPDGVFSFVKRPSFTMTYYLGLFESDGVVSFVPLKTDPIDVYADRLSDVVDEVLRITNSTKLSIVAHSMGGLVARKYLSVYGSDKVDSLITISTPHQGIKSFRVSFVCPLLGSELECEQMVHNSLFMRSLDYPSNVSFFNVVVLGCSDSDGVFTYDEQKAFFGSEIVLNRPCSSDKRLHNLVISEPDKDLLVVLDGLLS